MNFLAPAPGSTLEEIFQAKITKIDQQDTTECEKLIISAKLIAYLKWLIYTAAFKDPSAGECGVLNNKFFTDWVQEIFSKEQGYSKFLLEELQIWYTKHPQAKKRGRNSIEQGLPRLVPGNVITLDDWELENDDDDDDAGSASGRAAGGDGGPGS
jgi:lipase chaperone LimK